MQPRPSAETFNPDRPIARSIMAFTLWCRGERSLDPAGRRAWPLGPDETSRNYNVFGSSVVLPAPQTSERRGPGVSLPPMSPRSSLIAPPRGALSGLQGELQELKDLLVRPLGRVVAR